MIFKGSPIVSHFVTKLFFRTARHIEMLHSTWMSVCMHSPHASLESAVGDHAGKAVAAFPGVYVEVAKVSMEGL